MNVPLEEIRETVPLAAVTAAMEILHPNQDAYSMGGQTIAYYQTKEALGAALSAIRDDLKRQLLEQMAERMTMPSVYASIDPAGYERGRADAMRELYSALETLG